VEFFVAGMEELAAPDAEMRAVRTARPGVALVQREAGIGKFIRPAAPTLACSCPR
jgi:hypothetical protein